jgi:NB-ARC domain
VGFLLGGHIRKKELHTALITTILSHLTDSQERHILSLSGPAGYGKTNAASCAASAAFTKKLFEDVLWVKARQSELVEGTITSETRAEALDWEQFCVEIAYQLKCPIEQVHQQLRENRLLIVIDNAETANIGSIFAQLVPMLNPSKALLTSRTNYEPRLVKQIPITGLDLESARQLILHEAKENNISVLLEAKNKQIEHIHQLTLGAPLALHFVVSRICHDEAISPVLHELERADKHVETFYKFTLETAWQRITEVARKIMLHVGEANSHVSHEELIGILSSKGFLESDLNAAKRDLKRWHLLEEKLHGESEKRRYDLHPWVRSCIRANLVNNWEPSLQDLRQRFKWKFDKE